MSEALEPCAVCARHLRVSATRCPFCDAAHEARAVVEFEPSPLRVPRSALLAAGAALAFAGCASTMQAPPYGQAAMMEVRPPPSEPEPTAAPQQSADAGAAQSSSPGIVPIYGAPAPRE